MAFLENLHPFYGTGKRNRAGETLEEFLDHYDPKKYDCPSNTTDIVVVRCREALTHWGQPLEVLLVKRSNHPSIGCWATPGGFVELKEDLEAGAARELEEEPGVKGLPLKQLTTWGAYGRDPRWRVITTSFLALVEGDVPVKAGDDADDALWFQVSLTRDPEASREIWHLELCHKEQGISLSSKVQICRSSHPLLTQERYQLLASDGIAVDHGCIITQALLELRRAIEAKIFF